jgi:hypothetical protein
MGKIANNFQKSEIEILHKILGDYILEQEVIYSQNIRKDFYKLFSRLTEMKGVNNERPK